MSNPEFAKSIANLWKILSDAELEETFSNPNSLKASSDFKKIAMDPESNYEDIYLSGARNSDYNIMMRDHSFFQFKENTDGCRLAFYPNPFFGADKKKLAETSEMREFVDEGIMSIEDYLHAISEIRSPTQAPLIRYEYSIDGYRHLEHPCGHLHVGAHSENRWPVERYLTPKVFGMFVIRLYYFEHWRKIPAIQSGKEKISIDEYFMRKKSACPKTPEEHLSDQERRLFIVA